MATTAILEFRLRPDQLEAAYATVHDVLTVTRAFPGCLDIEVLIDTADEAHLVVVEHWESLEADSPYRAWRATPEGATGLGDFLAAVPVLTILTSSEL